MLINITVKPNSSIGPLIKEEGELIVAHINEIPVENRVNKSLIKLISKHYKIPKTNIKIIRGHKSRYKTIEIGEQNGQKTH